jgi:hypothetical protein
LGRPEGKLDRAKARLLDVPFWTDFAKLFASQVRGCVLGRHEAERI